MLELNNWNLKRLYRERVGPALFAATREEQLRFDRFAALRTIFEQCGKIVQMGDYRAVDSV